MKTIKAQVRSEFRPPYSGEPQMGARADFETREAAQGFLQQLTSLCMLYGVPLRAQIVTPENLILRTVDLSAAF